MKYQFLGDFPFDTKKCEHSPNAGDKITLKSFIAENKPVKG